VETPKRLIILGAGPKALAIAAKAAALRAASAEVPAITILEKSEIGAHWNGRHGFTDGFQPLVTPPEMDVGFPYSSDHWGPAKADIDRHMLRYSWSSYKVLGEASESYRSWIDRGRPFPTLVEWSEYLRWVAEQVDIDFQQGEAVEIGVTEEGRWRIAVAGDPVPLVGDGLVVTGPRVPKPLGVPNCFNALDFWDNLELFRGAYIVCVVGAGLTASPMVEALLSLLRPVPQSYLYLISKSGFVFSQGRGHDETRHYIDPTDWPRMRATSRREFLRRVDRGVLLPEVSEALKRARITYKTVAGEAKMETVRDHEGFLEVPVIGHRRPLSVDFLLDARNMNRRWFVDLFEKAVVERLETIVSSKESLEHSIDFHLKVNDFTPNLHLPMLASFAQGPGFPNLHCLGLLSDRILACYCKLPG